MCSEDKCNISYNYFLVWQSYLAILQQLKSNRYDWDFLINESKRRLCNPMQRASYDRGSTPVIQQDISRESLQLSSLPVNVNVITSFLHIHLKDEYEKLAYSRSDFIRYRQIIEHAELTLVDGSSKHEYLLDLLKKVWMETIIETCFEDFEQEYIKAENSNIRELKKIVAERYLFELCKLREFVESGRRNFEGKEMEKELNLSAIFSLSDENLYQVLQRKNSIFLNKLLSTKVDYPKNLQSFTRYKYDLLTSFKPQSIDEDMFLNKDYIFQDIRFLLNLAVKEWDNYQSDMAILFQGKLETNLKVKKEDSGGFNVIGVRRILTKWVEILLENDKKLSSSSRFYNFVTKKMFVFDTFYMNDKDSRVPPCQEKLCHLLLELLISSAYHGNERNPEFGLYIYDLLRGKISVESIDEADELCERLANPPPTLKNKIEVFRMKNRLKTHNRDLLINFRYGDILAAEIQIGLSHYGSVEERRRHKILYEYKHFMYQLSRSIFGPTIELMNIYEDYYKKQDIQMYSTGMVSLRDTKPFEGIKITEKECFAGHKLIEIKAELKKNKELCRRCFEQLEDHFHCFQCTVSFCTRCVEQVEKKSRMIEANKQTGELKSLHRIEELYNLEGYNLVIFHLQYSPASKLMLRYLSSMVDLQESPYNILVVDVLEDPRIKYYIQEYLHINRFPAFALFHHSDLLKCIIGASLYKIMDLINLLQTQNPSKKCPLDHELVKKKPASYVFWTCNQCYKPRDKSQEEIFYCTECLYCCCSECGFCKNDMECFQDKHGTSYLSTAIVDEQQVECSKKHKMSLYTSNPEEKSLYYCSSCKNDFFYIGEVGIYCCSLCHEYKCNFCTESGLANISSQNQYANHSVEPYILGVPLCSECNRPHKYSDHSKQGKEWMCRNCKNPFRESYHISCQKCQRHYCSACKFQIKSKDEMITMATECSCQKGRLMPQQRKHNTFQTFMCMICFNRFYYNEPHHECMHCKFDFCNQCLETLKTKVKINILSQDIHSRTTITEYIFELPLTTTLTTLRESLKGCLVIPQHCTGKFKLPHNHEYLKPQQESLTISSLAPTYEIFYLKTLLLSEQLINTYIARFIHGANNSPHISSKRHQDRRNFEKYEQETSVIQFDDY